MDTPQSMSKRIRPCCLLEIARLKLNKEKEDAKASGFKSAYTFEDAKKDVVLEANIVLITLESLTSTDLDCFRR